MSDVDRDGICSTWTVKAEGPSRSFEEHDGDLTDARQDGVAGDMARMGKKHKRTMPIDIARPALTLHPEQALHAPKTHDKDLPCTACTDGLGHESHSTRGAPRDARTPDPGTSVKCFGVGRGSWIWTMGNCSNPPGGARKAHLPKRPTRLSAPRTPWRSVAVRPRLAGLGAVSRRMKRRVVRSEHSPTNFTIFR